MAARCSRWPLTGGEVLIVGIMPEINQSVVTDIVLGSMKSPLAAAKMQAGK